MLYIFPQYDFFIFLFWENFMLPINIYAIIMNYDPLCPIEKSTIIFLNKYIHFINAVI